VTFYWQINVFSDLNKFIISLTYICALRVGNKVANGLLHDAVHGFYVYGSVHHNIFYEITNRCSYVVCP